MCVWCLCAWLSHVLPVVRFIEDPSHYEMASISMEMESSGSGSG